jgi:hypothetical protein
MNQDTNLPLSHHRLGGGCPLLKVERKKDGVSFFEMAFCLYFYLRKNQTS